MRRLQSWGRREAIRDTSKGMGGFLVAVDFSERSAAAVSLAVELAVGRDVFVDLLHVVGVGSGLGLGQPEAQDALSRAAMQETRRTDRELESLLATIPRPHRGEAIIRAGVPADVICQESASYSLVIVATAGRTGLQAVLIGSVAEEVVRNAPVPVLVVR